MRNMRNMAFVKLDTGILDSTLWIERVQREVFITSLLLAQPREIHEPMPQYEVSSLEQTGFIVPPGWYGFVAAAGTGILRRALVDTEEGMKALEALGNEDLESRTSDFGGRRLVRVNGGFIVLNFFKFRDKDHTAAERMRRLRERRKVTANVPVTKANVTQADSREQIAEAVKTPLPPLQGGYDQKQELEGVNAIRARQKPPLAPFTWEEYARGRDAPATRGVEAPRRRRHR